MKKKISVIGIITLLVSVGLSGCNSSLNEKLIGSWIGENNTPIYTFYNNGSVFVDMNIETSPFEYWADYTINKTTLTIDEVGYRYKISADGKQLLLNDNIIFIRLIVKEA